MGTQLGSTTNKKKDSNLQMWPNRGWKRNIKFPFTTRLCILRGITLNNSKVIHSRLPDDDDSSQRVNIYRWRLCTRI